MLGTAKEFGSPKFFRINKALNSRMTGATDPV